MLTESAQLRTSLRDSSEPPFDSHRQRLAEQFGRSRLNVSSSLSRSARIDRKVDLAHQWLAALAAPASDARRPLLRLAALRRDEALVDGILASFDAERQRGLCRHNHGGGKLELCGEVAG
jgi:hypothetical protein